MALKHSPAWLLLPLAKRRKKALSILPVLVLAITFQCAEPPVCLAILDSNTNGLSDVWETAFNYPPIQASGDSDSDGQTDEMEALAGTDPFDAQSFFAATVVEGPFDCYLVRWSSVKGKSYVVEGAPQLSNPTWTSHSSVVQGTGGEAVAAVPRAPGARFFRVRLSENWAIRNGLDKLEPDLDNDGDGLSDVQEFFAGTHPYDPESRLSMTSGKPGRAATLAWPSVVGKLYHLQAHNPASGLWTNLGPAIPGAGGVISNAVEIAEEGQTFRVVVSDDDTDGDGVSEWEMILTGVPTAVEAARDPTGLPPADAIRRILAATNVVEVQIGAPIANIGTGEPAEFVIIRHGNLNKMTVRFQLSGDAIAGNDFEPLPEEVSFAAGQKQARIAIKPLGQTGLPSKKLVLSLSEYPSYIVGTNSSAEVPILSEISLSVRDFGAVGDGVADDTLAIQAAIDALEASTSHNTLRFPAGLYRLNRPTQKSDHNGVWLQFLLLGKTNLGGRDLIFSGEPGSVLYSTVSTNRVRMLMVFANFRSLTFRGMTWRKDENLLPFTSGEPNGAEAVWLLGQGVQKVEAVDFVDCRFENCQGAVAAYGYGYNARGMLNRMMVRDCVVSNPLGPNSKDAFFSYGGGQQIRMNAWVRLALYSRNTFDGGSRVQTRLNEPRKDGSHFGGPLELVFTNNLVEYMGVEAVFATDEPLMGTTSEAFTIPSTNGLTARFKTRPFPTTYRPGQVINVRTVFHPGATTTNVLLKVVGFESAENALTVQNEGLTPRVVGLTVPTAQPIYCQDYAPGSAIIADNIIDGRGGYTFNGISSNCKARIFNNLVTDSRYGIHFYPDVRNVLNPPSRGTVVCSNVIVTQDSSLWPGKTWGIDSSASSEVISHNLIITPRSYFFNGITVRGTNAWIEGNLILPQVIQRLGTGSFLRSVGVSFGHVATLNTSKGNFTSGLDIGIGPEVVNTYPSYRVISHYSTNDLMAVDPTGLVP